MEDKTQESQRKKAQTTVEEQFRKKSAKLLKKINGERDARNDGIETECAERVADVTGCAPSTGTQRREEVVDKGNGPEGNPSMFVFAAHTSDDELLNPSISSEYFRTHPNSLPPLSSLLPPPQVVDPTHAFTNMVLAHEISVNEEFTLSAPPQDPNSLETRVKEQMKKAFWDLFEENIKKCPPDYTHALILLKELKESLLGLLFSHNSQIRREIERVLDLDFITQQVEQGAFEKEEFRAHASFIIDCLSKICCPVRDSAIAALNSLYSYTDIFRGILDVVELMKVDMANFLIQDSRQLIVKHAVAYERAQFADYLESAYEEGIDGLRVVRSWLAEHSVPNREIGLVLAKAYAQILTLGPSSQWPETLLLDSERLMDFSAEIKRLAFIASAVLTLATTHQALYGNGICVNDLREAFKNHLKKILTAQNVREETTLKEALEVVGDEAVFITNEFVKKVLKRHVEDSEAEAIRTSMREMANKDHKITRLLYSRIVEYLEDLVLAHFSYPVSLPAGLTCIQHEVTATVLSLYRVLIHNQKCFTTIYSLLISSSLPLLTFSPSSDAHFMTLLKKLREPYLEGRMRERVRRREERGLTPTTNSSSPPHSPPPF